MKVKEVLHQKLDPPSPVEAKPDPVEEEKKVDVLKKIKEVEEDEKKAEAEDEAKDARTAAIVPNEAIKASQAAEAKFD